MRIFSLTIVVALFALPASAAAKKSVADSLPPDMALVITSPSCQSLVKNLDAGPLGRILAEKGVAEHADRAGKMLREFWNTERDFTDLRKVIQAGGMKVDDLFEIVTGEVTLAFGDVQSIDLGRGEPDVVVVLGGGERVADIQKALQVVAPLVAQSGGMKIEQAKHQGVDMQVLSKPGGKLQVVFAVQDGRLIFSTRRARMERILDALSGGDVQTLGAQPWQVGLRKHLGGAPVDLALHMNLPTEADAAAAGVRDRDIKSLLRGFETADVAGAHYVASFGEKDVRESILLRPRTRALDVAAAEPVFQAIEPAAFDGFPRGTFAAALTRVSLRGVLARAEKIADAATRPGMLRAGIAGSLVLHGLDLDKDVFGAFDGHVAVSASLPAIDGMPASLIPDVLLSMGLKDTAAADKLGSSLKTFLQTWPRVEIKEGTAGGNPFVTTEVEAGMDQRWRTGLFRLRRGEVSPSFGRLDKRLLLSPWSETVKRQLAGGDDGRAVTDWAGFQQARAELGEGASLFLFLDTRALLTFGWNTMVFLVHVEERYPPFDPVAMPDGSAIARHLSGTGLSLKSTDDGQLLRITSPLGLLGGGTLLTASAVYLEEQQSRARVAARNGRLHTRMTELYKGLLAFRKQKNRDPTKLSELYPDTVKDLANYSANERVWRPRQTARAKKYIDQLSTFLFMPAELGAAGKPVLASNPSRVGGGDYPVLFGDGQIKEMTRQELYAALRQAGYSNNGRPLQTQKPRPQPRPKPRPAPVDEEDPF